MEVARKLISEDKERLNQIVGEAMLYQSRLQAVKSGYTDLGIGPFTDEVFKSLGKPLKRDDLRAVYVEGVKEQCVKGGISNPSIQQSLLKIAAEAFDRFEDVCIELYNFQPHSASRELVLTVNHITYDEQSESFVVSKDTRELLSEQYCRTYLNEGEETEWYNAATRIHEAYVEFAKMARLLGMRDQDSALRLFGANFVSADGPDAKFSKEAVIGTYRRLKRLQKVSNT